MVSVSSGKAYDVVTAAESAEYYIDRTYTIAGFGGAVEVATVTMEYDQLNRMTKYTGPEGEETFAYRGAEWHRCAADSTGFMYDADNVVADVVGGDVDRTYVTPFLDQNVSMTTSGEAFYYSQDGLGSVRTVTDASANVQNRYDYLPFGGAYGRTTLVSVEQRYTYTGREEAPTGALMYYRYRSYRPHVGRFTERDPIGYRGGIGLYGYVLQRPTVAVDPLGLECGACHCVLYILFQYDPDPGVRVPGISTNAELRAKRDKAYSADSRPKSPPCPKFRADVTSVGVGFANLDALVDQYLEECKLETSLGGETSVCTELAVYIVGHGAGTPAGGVHWPLQGEDLSGYRFDQLGGSPQLQASFSEPTGPTPPQDSIRGPRGARVIIGGYKSVFAKACEVTFATCFGKKTADELYRLTGGRVATSGYPGYSSGAPIAASGPTPPFGPLGEVDPSGPVGIPGFGRAAP